MLEIDRKQSRVFDYIAGVFSANRGQYITTILVGNNITLVVYSLCMSRLLRMLASAFGWTGMQDGSIFLETVIPTIIVLFVAEYFPKSLVKHNPNLYYRVFAPVIFLFYVLLYPVARLTTLMAYSILRIFGKRVDRNESDAKFHKEELEDLLDANNCDAQSETDNELKIFQNALDFADLRVRDCMISRVDIEAVDVDDCTIEQLTQRFVKSMFSRIFVYRDSVDNIIGYVNSKSLFHNPKTVEEVLMKVDYVTETMLLQDMLTQFIKKRASIAVVIDEFGGTAGIIALEDVLEEIFGEIEDEHDLPDMTEKTVAEGEYLFSCRLEVDYLNEKYGLSIPVSDDYDTLAGYIIFRSEGLPEVGAQMEFDGMRIKILQKTRSRIELARVKVL